jgi:hypothetical protein
VPGRDGGFSGIYAGALFEGYFGPLTVGLNLKSIDPTMKHTDYLQTIQLGFRYDVPGLGFFRLQMIGFDPDGEITGNYYKIDNAASQLQFAANITGLPGMEFRVGFHYYLSKSLTNWVDGLDSTYNFDADKNSFAFPLGFEVTMFNPFSFRMISNIQFGKDPDWGQNIYHFKFAIQGKYVFSSYITGLLNVSAYNFGKIIIERPPLTLLGDKDPGVDIGLGIQLNNIRGASLQTGLVFQIRTAENTQLGVAIPFTFDFGF